MGWFTFSYHLLLLQSRLWSFECLKTGCKKKLRKLLNEHLNNPLARISVIRVKFFSLSTLAHIAFFCIILWMTMKKASMKREKFIHIIISFDFDHFRWSQKKNNNPADFHHEKKATQNHLNWIYLYRLVVVRRERGKKHFHEWVMTGVGVEPN